MTATDIFREAIKKAIDKDWTAFMRKPFKEIDGVRWEVIEVDKVGGQLVPVLLITADEGRIKLFYEVEQVIFDHDFCRAVFGEAEPQSVIISQGPAQQTGRLGWQRHIAAMVLSTHRLDYLHDQL